MTYDEFAKLDDDDKWAAIEALSDDELEALMTEAAQQLPREHREWLADQFGRLYTGEDDED